MKTLPLLKCESCGAPLKTEYGQNYVICEYCGTQTVLNEPVVQSTTINGSPDERGQDYNKLFLSIPSCGSSIFQKKIFNIYGDHAELIDKETMAVEQHILFSNVVKFQQMLGMAMIIFKMSDGSRIFIKLMYEGKTKEALNVLNGLVKPIK